MKLFTFCVTVLYILTCNKITAKPNNIYYPKRHKYPYKPNSNHKHEYIDIDSVRITIQDNIDYYSDDTNSESDGRTRDDNNWSAEATKAIRVAQNYQPNTNRAKNVIVFSGEDLPIYALKMVRRYAECFDDPCINDKPPHTMRDYFHNIARVKSSCYDTYNPDLACLATAMLTGSENNKGTVAVNHKIKFNQKEYKPHDKLNSLIYWAQQAGKRTGLVTTGLLTSPSVSPSYGHTSNYKWQSDYDMAQDNVYLQGADLASQLIQGKTGSNLNVILGGGRKKFVPTPKYGGERLDRRNLIKEWLKSKRGKGEYTYIHTREDLSTVCRHTDYVLGLFDLDTLNHDNDPTLEELTATAIGLLDRKGATEKGYVLFIQSSNIYPDRGNTVAEVNTRNHLEYIAAVKTAIKMTDSSDTLIVALRDDNFKESKTWKEEQFDIKVEYYERDELHSHWIYYAFGIRVNDIHHRSYSGVREVYKIDECNVRNEAEESLALAYGPFGHLFSGTIHQYNIPYFIGYAACIGEGPQMCDV